MSLLQNFPTMTANGSYLQDLPGLTNPITHAGRVVYNAQRDSLETHRRERCRAGDDLFAKVAAAYNPNARAIQSPAETFSIQTYELCVRNRQDDRNPRYAPNDTDIYVFSSANKMSFEGTLPDDDADPQVMLAAKRLTLDFGGIASNRAIYDPNNNANEEGLAVQMGGLQTIYNTGPGPIYAGDIILWDMPALITKGPRSGHPLNRIPGVPKDKLLFSTVRFDPDALQDDTFLNTQKEALIRTYNKAPRKEMLPFRVMNDIQRRVIGKALSNADKGKPFDILLGHYCV